MKQVGVVVIMGDGAVDKERNLAIIPIGDHMTSLAQHIFAEIKKALPAAKPLTAHPLSTLNLPHSHFLIDETDSSRKIILPAVETALDKFSGDGGGSGGGGSHSHSSHAASSSESKAKL